MLNINGRRQTELRLHRQPTAWKLSGPLSSFQPQIAEKICAVFSTMLTSIRLRLFFFIPRRSSSTITVNLMMHAHLHHHHKTQRHGQSTRSAWPNLPSRGQLSIHSDSSHRENETRAPLCHFSAWMLCLLSDSGFWGFMYRHHTYHYWTTPSLTMTSKWLQVAIKATVHGVVCSLGIKDY